jgi:hypothetical protein
MTRLTRRRLLGAGLTAGAAGLAGCSGILGRTGLGSDPPADGDDGGRPPLADRRLPVMYGFDRLRDEVRSGGPPKDGIPSIDDPSFVGPSGGDGFLDDGDVVFGFAGETDVRAYPQSILVQHEIVNDTLDGLPVSVTYCPLTGTAMGFERGATTFGTSGNLLNNNLVMYDRGTDSRWPQVLGTAISGDLEGESLREFRLVWTTWSRWTAAHPDTAVLSRATGFARNYDRDPYGQYNPIGGYYDSERLLFAPLRRDDRYGNKEPVLGVRVPAGAIAFHAGSLAEAGVLEGSLDGTAHTAVHDVRFGTGHVYRNPEGVDVTLDGNRATVAGESYAPDALPLERVYAFDAMWFAWAGFYPETAVVA